MGVRSVTGLSALAADLRRMDIGAVLTQVDLRDYSRWRCGGSADLVIEPSSPEAVARLLTVLGAREIDWAVIGAGSNIFFDDRGVRAVLIRIGDALRKIEVNGDVVSAQAGASAPRVARAALRAGRGGIEHIIGIPGTIGGLVVMNGGSLRRSIGDSILDIALVTPSGAIESWKREQCAFAYRASRLQQQRGIVVGVRLSLTRAADRNDMRREMISIMAARRKKFPKDLPNCGSVFASDPARYADYGPPGAVIEACGLKGMRIGDALVSPRHANFIVNMGCARSSDIAALISHVRSVVRERTGWTMRSEVKFMDASGIVFEAGDLS
jgi:UDP-N-acetylmuramate dehydrogenase